MRTARLWPCAGLLVGIAACDNSFSPGELAGTYWLTTIDGNPPPHLELATTECDQSIIGGVLVLEADGTHALNMSISLDCTRGGGNVGFQERQYLGTFRVDGDRLEFSSVQQPEGENLEFRGQAEEGSVDVDLPSATIQGLFHKMRFEESEDCSEACPPPEPQAQLPAATHLRPALY